MASNNQAIQATKAASKAARTAASLRWIRSASARSPAKAAVLPMKRERPTSSRRKKRAKPVARAARPAARATGQAVRAAAAAAPAANSAPFDGPAREAPFSLAPGAWPARVTTHRLAARADRDRREDLPGAQAQALHGARAGAGSKRRRNSAAAVLRCGCLGCMTAGKRMAAPFLVPSVGAAVFQLCDVAHNREQNLLLSRFDATGLSSRTRSGIHLGTQRGLRVSPQ